MRRYAIYYAPDPASRLGDFASRWLGRDAATAGAVAAAAVADSAVARLRLPGLSAARQAEITRSAAHYGFHATLKPPFALIPDADEAALEAAVAALAAGQAAFPLGPLEIASLDGFLAVVPGAPNARLQALADSCVEALDRFRAPPGAGELARRRAAGLTARQGRHLVRWGYPYVFEDFRFHMTLTARLEPAERARVLSALAAAAESWITAPVAVDSVSVFVQAHAEAPFALHRRCRFGDG